jgi:hypothetical protein
MCIQPQSGELTVRPVADTGPDLWLHPNEVRYYFDEDNETDESSISDLASDIAKNGIRQPVVINTNGHHAYLDDGHHRTLAAQLLGLDRMPVRVVPGKYARSGDAEVNGHLKDWMSKQSGHTPWGYANRGLL